MIRIISTNNEENGKIIKIMSDELVDVIDKNNNIVGTELKSIVHKEGLRHRVSAVLLQDKNGKYLIPTASNIKVEAGLFNHSAAGHVPTGETYLKSARRELLEETGLSINERGLSYLRTFWIVKDYKIINVKERFEVFLAKYNPKMGKVKLNKEQVNEQWLSLEELRKIFIKSPEKLSYPLTLTCKYILKL